MCTGSGRLQGQGTGGRARPAWARKWLLGTAASNTREAQLRGCSLYSVAEARTAA